MIQAAQNSYFKHWVKEFTQKVHVARDQFVEQHIWHSLLEKL